MKIAIINYGAGNTQSVRYALQRLGVTPVLTNNADEISSADRVLFPGVGHAKAAMEALKENNLDKLIPTLNQPVLGICLGMQLMCKFSYEGNTPCLGIFEEEVKLFAPKLKVPHIGWNTASNNWYYFVHSYYVDVNPYTTQQCQYSVAFSAAMQKNNFYAVQYHPEKSGEAGEQVLIDFLK